MNNTNLPNKDTILELPEVEAAELYSNIRGMADSIEALKKERTGPLTAQIKAIREEYAQIETDIENVLTVLKEHLASFANNRAVTETAPVMAVKYKKIKKLVIHDVDLIPRELMIPDEKSIAELLKSGVVVPGCSLDSVKIVSL